MCRSRRELSNEYLLAKIGVDTAENEPLEVWGKIFNIIHWCNAVPDGRPMRYRSYRSIFPLLFFDFPRLLKYYLYYIHSLFVWRECLAHQVPIVLTVLSFRFSGLCLMVVNATIHFHGQASPVGVWSFLRLPLNPSRGKKKKRLTKKF